VDLFHAREHIHDLARQLEFMLGDRKDEWLAARLEDLDYGDIDGICDAARAYPLEGVKKDVADKALHYFEANAPRMRYHWFRQCGLFVGSGVVEAGCKAVIGQGSSSPACTGPSTAPTPSSPSAAPRPASSGKRPAAGRDSSQQYQPERLEPGLASNA
jgi:hypothetical protein